MDSLLDLYHDELKHISIEQQGSSCVLYCSVLAVVNFNSKSEEALRRNHSVAPVYEIFSASGEFISLPASGSHGIFQGLMHSASQPQQQEHHDIIAVEMDDASAAKSARGIENEHHHHHHHRHHDHNQQHIQASVSGLITFEKHAIIRNQIANLLAGQSYPLKPEMSSTERGIKETELLSFSSLSANDLYRNDQMQMAATMLQSHVRALPNFTGTLMSANDESTITRRRYFRHLSAETFAQILCMERVREPMVVKQYYSLTDDLLLALHWPPPERRIRKETWSWSGPLPVLATAESSVVKEKSVKMKGKKGKAVEKPAKRKSKKDLEPAPPTTISCTISTTTLTPAAHSIALIKKSTEHAASSWLTIYLDGSVLGLRMETSSILTADFLAVQDFESNRGIKSSVVSTARSHHSSEGCDGEDGEGDDNEEAEDREDGAGSPVGSHQSARSFKEESADQLDDADHIHTDSADREDGHNSLSDNRPSAVKPPGSLSTSALNTEPPRGVFFCHTEDDVRFSACAGPCPQPIKKPDGFGTICLIATFPDTSSVTVCSNGTTKFTMPQLPIHSIGAHHQHGHGHSHLKPAAPGEPIVFDAIVGVESERYIGPGGAVMSVYGKTSTYFTVGDGSHVQFWKEIREADGSRLLIVRPTSGPGVVSSLSNALNDPTLRDGAVAHSAKSAASTAPKLKGVHAFYQSLCDAAPVGFTCVKLSADGQVRFHTCLPHTSQLDTSEGIPHPAMDGNIIKKVLDAETKCTVSSFPDGRIIIQYIDGRRECQFGDGTVIVTHAGGAMVSIMKGNLPSVEIDTEIDAVSRQHAKGIEVPINKGGERVRSRIALPDGTAILVKYDTRLTTVTNGSIKLVRRDKTLMLLKDSGSVTYSPRAAWSAKTAAEFAAECADLPKPANNPTSPSRSVTISKGVASTVARGISTKSAAQSTSSPSNTNDGTPAMTAPSSSLSRSVNRVTEQPSGMGASITTNSTKSRKIVAAPGLVRRRSPTSRTGRTANTTGGTVALSSKEKVELDGEDSATFTFNINNFTCHILDYEFNSFEICLASDDPLSPGVVLSGEVEGLKPPAVADKPMDPRLFVVNRSAEATELLSVNQINAMETLTRTCPDVKKVIAPAHLSPAELGPATLTKYFVNRRLLGSRCDAFTFEEVFGERYWYPHGAPAAALHADLSNRLALMKMQKKKKNGGGGAIPPPARYFETMSVIEQLPLSQGGHVELRAAIKQCEDFRTNRLQSLDRFKVEEDRSQEELDEEEALAKRLKLAFKAAKVVAAKKKEQKAKLAAAAAPTIPEEPSPLKHTSTAIPEGANEDGEDEEEDVVFPGDDDEPKEVDPEEAEVRDTFEDFSVQNGHEMYVGEESFTIHKGSLQEAFIRLFNQYISTEMIEREISMCEECDGSFEELTYMEFKALYYSTKASLAALNEQENNRSARVSTWIPEPSTLASHSDDYSNASAPTYWQSPQGKKAMGSLPAVAPPLDLRKLEWNGSPDDADVDVNSALGAAALSPVEYYDGTLLEDEEEGPVQGRLVSTAYPAVGSALQAARRSNSNRAVTAPE